MRILVIGGTRFLGLFMVRELVRRGHEVTVFHRGVSEPPDPQDPVDRAPHVHGDRRDPGDLARALARGFDAIVDVDPRNDVNVNALLEAAAGRAGRAVFISSIHVYAGIHGGETQPVPFDEERSAIRESPLYPYRGGNGDRDDFDAVLVERAALSRGPEVLDGVIALRMPVIYGPHDYLAREYPWIQAVQHRRRTLVLGYGASWLQQRIWVADAARAVALALETEPRGGRAFNVGEHEVRTVAQLALEVGHVLGWNFEILVVPDPFLPASLALFAQQPQHWWSDTSRFRTVTGFTEVLPHEERLRQTLEWHLAHPPPPELYPVPDYSIEDHLIALLRQDGEQGTAEPQEERP